MGHMVKEYFRFPDKEKLSIYLCLSIYLLSVLLIIAIICVHDRIQSITHACEARTLPTDLYPHFTFLCGH